MPSAYIPDDHSLLRYVPYAKLRKDGDQNIIGVLATAFCLRPNEEYLSATWIEYFQPNLTQTSLAQAVLAVRASDLNVKTKSGFAVGAVGKIKGCCTEHNCRVRVIHEKSDDNEAHVALRHWPAENERLFALMADEAWAEWHLNSSFD